MHLIGLVKSSFFSLLVNYGVHGLQIKFNNSIIFF